MGWPGPMTHRQYEVVNFWLDEEWNRPSRSDHYLMQLNGDFRAANAKNPRSVKAEDLVIKFKKKRKADPKKAAEESKKRWLSLFGDKVRVVKPGETPPP